jgi:hypothetical protein
MHKAPERGAVHPADDDINRISDKLRAHGEQPFLILNR